MKQAFFLEKFVVSANIHMKTITDPDGNKWKESKKILEEDSIREVDVWTGTSYKKQRMVSKAGTEVRSYTYVKSKEESNKIKAASVVSRSLRRHLEEQGYYGKLNETGNLMLRLEYKRGGNKPKAPIWWIVKNAALLKIKHPWKNRYGIAIALSKLAEKEFGEYVKITNSDIKNARRAIK